MSNTDKLKDEQDTQEHYKRVKQKEDALFKIPHVP
jgi:hypothetical protein